MKNIVKEMAGLFPDSFFHLGMDETRVVQNCTQNSKYLVCGDLSFKLKELCKLFSCTCFSFLFICFAMLLYFLLCMRVVPCDILLCAYICNSPR